MISLSVSAGNRGENYRILMCDSRVVCQGCTVLYDSGRVEGDVCLYAITLSRLKVIANLYNHFRYK